MAKSETTKQSPGNDAAIDQLGCERSEWIRAQRTQRTKELNVAFRFGGMPYEVAERGLKLFAKEVLPVLKAQSPAAARQAAE